MCGLLLQFIVQEAQVEGALTEDFLDFRDWSGSCAGCCPDYCRAHPRFAVCEYRAVQLGKGICHGADDAVAEDVRLIYRDVDVLEAMLFCNCLLGCRRWLARCFAVGTIVDDGFEAACGRFFKIRVAQFSGDREVWRQVGNGLHGPRSFQFVCRVAGLGVARVLVDATIRSQSRILRDAV